MATYPTGTPNTSPGGTPPPQTLGTPDQEGDLYFTAINTVRRERRARIDAVLSTLALQSLRNFEH